MEHEVLWSPGVTIAALEQRVIEKAYRFYGQNKTATAISLGISIRTLDNKLEKYELEKLAQEERNAEEERRRRDFLARSRGVIPAQFNTANGSTDSTGRAWSDSQPLANTTAQRAVPVPKRSKV